VQSVILLYYYIFILNVFVLLFYRQIIYTTTLVFLLVTDKLQIHCTMPHYKVLTALPVIAWMSKLLTLKNKKSNNVLSSRIFFWCSCVCFIVLIFLLPSWLSCVIDNYIIYFLKINLFNLIN